MQILSTYIFIQLLSQLAFHRRNDYISGSLSSSELKFEKTFGKNSFFLFQDGTILSIFHEKMEDNRTTIVVIIDRKIKNNLLALIMSHGHTLRLRRKVRNFLMGLEVFWLSSGISYKLSWFSVC